MKQDNWKQYEHWQKKLDRVALVLIFMILFLFLVLMNMTKWS